MNKNSAVLVVVLALIISSIAYLESIKPQKAEHQQDIIVKPSQDTDAPDPRAEIVGQKAKKYERAKEITTPDGFINVDNITISEHVGKNVVLVDFWTYSCINCQRTLPYLESWHEKYGEKGLMIIGLHTPEFEFEKDYGNVLAATKKFGVKYPVVMDNDFSTWRAYGNRYWPRKYLIDIDGFIVFDHIGEGAYEETEQAIKALLEERDAKLRGEPLSQANLSKMMPEVTRLIIESIVATSPKSPEIYFGSLRNDRFGNGQKGKGGVQSLSEPQEIKPDTLYLAGEWDIQPEYAENLKGGAKIVFQYLAKDVFIVASSDEGVRLSVTRDGKPLGAEAGADVLREGEKSRVTVKDSSLYKLVQDVGTGQHTLEITVEDAGLQAFTFTFG